MRVPVGTPGGVAHAEDEHDLVSHGSGGFWFPYLVENMDRVGPWAKATYDAFLSEMRASPFYKPGSVNNDALPAATDAHPAMGEG